MKKINFALAITFTSFCSLLYAQEANTLILTSPAEIAGNYIVSQPITWGQKVDTFSGTAVLIDDGFGILTDACQPLNTDLTGFIAVIDKGNCDQTEQVINVQNRNAVAAIICNNHSSNPLYKVDLQAVPIFPDDGKGFQVKIPVFTMSIQDCTLLKLGQEKGAKELSFNYSCNSIVRDKVIWGDHPGQGDFSKGLGDWSVISDRDTSWYWSDNRIIKGRYTSADQAVEGTACNGYIAFPSDFYDTNGIPFDPSDPHPINSGICRNNGLNGEFCSGSLYSPIIDLSGDSIKGLFCSFYHDWGYYYGGSTSLIVSYDEGISWSDTIHISLAERSELTNPEVNQKDDCIIRTATVNERGEGFYTLPLSSYNGEASVQLQFRHQGGYYHATIDDVALISASYPDIEIITTDAALALAAAMPICQANEIPLEVSLINKGNMTATNIAVRATALDGNGNTEWTATHTNYEPKSPLCYIDEQSSFSDGFTPTQLGDYIVTYQNLTDNDGISMNDTFSFDLELTERIWRSVDKPLVNSDSSYNHVFIGLEQEPGPGSDRCGYKDILGYAFYLPHGAEHTLDKLTFGINYKPTNSGEIRAYLLEWNQSGTILPGFFDYAGSYQIPHEERKLVGMMSQNSTGQVDNSESVSNLKLDNSHHLTIGIAAARYDPINGEEIIYDSSGNVQPAVLKDDQMYVLVLVLDPTEYIPLELIAGDTRLNSSVNLNASNTALENLGKTQRYGLLVHCSSDEDDGYAIDLDTLDLNSSSIRNIPWLEMEINPIGTNGCGISSTQEQATREIGALKVYPNPASTQLFINVELPEQVDRLMIELIDINGNIVKTLSDTKVKLNRTQLNLEDIPSGVYTIKAQSAAGSYSEKIVIVK